MRLYHYTTWKGEQINMYRWVRPSNRYNLSCNIKLTFLTACEEWEPSLQAQSFEGYYEKCGSHPLAYDELRIPCWKFQVAYGRVIRFHDFNLNHIQWDKMKLSATQLGSNMDDWYVTYEPVPVYKSWKWTKGGWRLL